MDALMDNVINYHWQHPDQQNTQSSLWSYVSSYWTPKSDMKTDMLIHRTTEMIQIWADLTMMY